MSKLSRITLITITLAVGACAGCSSRQANTNTAGSISANTNTNVTANSNAAPPAAGQVPAKTFTAADIAKLKWLEGTWRGMDDNEPFVERYHFDGTTMIVESLSDDDPSKVEDTSRFELKDGEFGIQKGDSRSAASEITDDHVQFVPVKGGNSFRFERQPGGTWRAVLEWTEDNKPQRKEYKMEPYKK